MARKHSLPPHNMLLDADMSGSLLSAPTNVSQIDQAIIFLNWSGGAEGEFTVEGAQVKSTELRADSPLPASIVWNTLSFGSTVLAEIGNDNHELVFTQLPFTHIRIRYTPSAGTGTLNATISGKSLGA